ncbi:hypothetical protein J6590_089686 [Homalodisca vitripennis]|nr:hypothetical protein J6590_060482 [Homalodisca vitripennis]KAG8309301.1 hypothetical protein J6590_089686 [Homalodisca vitripennis]
MQLLATDAAARERPPNTSAMQLVKAGGSEWQAGCCVVDVANTRVQRPGTSSDRRGTAGGKAARSEGTATPVTPQSSINSPLYAVPRPRALVQVANHSEAINCPATAMPVEMWCQAVRRAIENCTINRLTTSGKI